MQYQSRPISLTERYVYHSSVLAVPARNAAGASMPVEGAQPVIEKFEQFKQRIATIQQQLDDEKRTAAAGVLADIRECVRLFGLTPRDIFGDAMRSRRRAGSAPRSTGIPSRAAPGAALVGSRPGSRDGIARPSRSIEAAANSATQPRRWWRRLGPSLARRSRPPSAALPRRPRPSARRVGAEAGRARRGRSLPGCSTQLWASEAFPSHQRPARPFPASLRSFPPIPASPPPSDDASSHPRRARLSPPSRAP